MPTRKTACLYRKKCQVESCGKWFLTQYNQTKYCPSCAKALKRAATAESLDKWSPEELQLKNNKAQQKFRKEHPGISTQYVRRHRERKRQQLQANIVGLVSARQNNCQSGDIA